jgi:hypothetical protein
MAQRTPQTLQNHVRFFPLFHFVAVPLLIVCFFRAVFVAVTDFTVANAFGVAFTLALVLLALTARRMALTVQDRLIRLEERLRMRALLPSDLQPRVDEFTVDQLIGLRFASDEELPALCRKVLDEKLSDRKTIKKLVKNWTPDYLRV